MHVHYYENKRTITIKNTERKSNLREKNKQILSYKTNEENTDFNSNDLYIYSV